MSANYEHYRIFNVVAECGSITAAAEKLFISQPAVSQSLKTLESTIGCKLFLRAAKGVKLTPEGQLLYIHVKQGCESIENGERMLKKLLELEKGEIRIGASDMTLRFFLLPWLEKFHRAYPNIKITVTNGPTPETLQYLREGKIDFGAVSAPFDSDRDFVVKAVRRIKDIFVAGPGFSDLKGRVLKLSMLSTLPLIFLDQKTSTRRYVDTFLASNSANKNSSGETEGDIPTFIPEFELSTSELIVEFAERNLGIGSVVADFAKKSIDSGNLFKLIFEKEPPERDICLVTDRRIPVSPAAKKLLEMISGVK